MSKVFIIGLDCAEPTLVFDRWRDQLPNFKRLMQQGVYGNLESCTPAITVPAWSVMTSSKDPGTLGIYGFRNRADYSYDKMTIATGSAVNADRVWDILSRSGKRVNVVGVQGTYPPRSDRLLRRSGVALPRFTRPRQYLHLRERHWSRRCQSRAAGPVHPL